MPHAFCRMGFSWVLRLARHISSSLAQVLLSQAHSCASL